MTSTTSKPHPHPSYHTTPNLSLSLSSLLPPSIPRILIPLSPTGHDPTTISTPYHHLTTTLGWHVTFATPHGEPPHADPALLNKSLFRKVLGASTENVEKYYAMVGSKEWSEMKRFGEAVPGTLGASTEKVDFRDYDAVVLPGGHDSSIVSWLKSEELHQQLRNFLPLCSRTSGEGVPAPGEKPYPQRVLGAIGHGVLTLVFAKYPEDYPDAAHAGKALIHDMTTTSVPQWMESVGNTVAGLALRMGSDYMRVFEGEWVEEVVCKGLDDVGKQWVRGPLATGLVGGGEWECVDKRRYYVSGRGGVDALAVGKAVGDEICRAREGFVEDLAAGKYVG